MRIGITDTEHKQHYRTKRPYNMHNPDNYIRYLEVLSLSLLHERKQNGGDELDDIRAVENDFPPTRGSDFCPKNARG